jgi:hypothetical protein
VKYRGLRMETKSIVNQVVPISFFISTSQELVEEEEMFEFMDINLESGSNVNAFQSILQIDSDNDCACE